MQTHQQVSDLINTNLPTAGSPLITAEDHREVEKAILDFARDQWLPGDLKMIDCTNAYITANFELNGLGKNERLGWAICNGFNGTRNRVGRVPVAYGATSGNVFVPSFPSMEDSEGPEYPRIGGNKDAVVVSHSHGITSGAVKPGGPYTLKYAGDFKFDYNYTTESAGVSGTDKNMQPYIVTLFIQKIDPAYQFV